MYNYCHTGHVQEESSERASKDRWVENCNLTIFLVWPYTQYLYISVVNATTCARSSALGIVTSISLSKRPGCLRAVSTASTLLVAPITTTDELCNVHIQQHQLHVFSLFSTKIVQTTTVSCLQHMLVFSIFACEQAVAFQNTCTCLFTTVGNRWQYREPNILM